MALVLRGLVVTFDPARPRVDDGAVYIGDDGRIAAVVGPGEPEPPGFATAPRIATGAVIYPGLIDLHNHLAYNCLPLWVPPGRTEPYTRRDQWPRDPAYTTDIHLPTVALTQVASKPLLKYVEVKAVVGGVTAIQGSAKLSRPYEGWLIRNVEYETFATGERSVFQSVRTLSAPDDFQTAREHMEAGGAFVYHLAEGTAPALRKEYVDLRLHDCLKAGLVAIHATALGHPEYQEWGPFGSSMVWSPLSNLWLYRATSDVVAARDAGIRVCLGADWSPSGSKSVLGELKVADIWNRRLGEDAFSDLALCEMVTANPADALGWGERVGRVRGGLFADLVVVDRHHPDPYRNLITATERHVRLVLVGGRAVYGTPSAMRAAGARNPEPIRVGGLRRSVSLRDDAIPDADMTWDEVVGALEAARHDPVQTHERLLRLAGAAGQEPLQLIPDHPGGEPIRWLTATELGKVEIPPIDSLTHDAAYFQRLASAPILDGILADLPGYYA